MITYGIWFYHELRDRIGAFCQNGHLGTKCITMETPNYGNFSVKVSSLRTQLFSQDPKCATCHRVGSLWMLQSHTKHDTPHLNLYHIIEEGEVIEKQWRKSVVDGLILITKDHIIPISKGGLTEMHNLRTLCCVCNLKKGNQSLRLEQQRCYGLFSECWSD